MIDASKAPSQAKVLCEYLPSSKFPLSTDPPGESSKQKYFMK